MASKLSGDEDNPIADINVTPFVDIILVVLIIFMVTTPVIMRPSLKIQLPKAASSDDSTPTQLNLAISKSGEFVLNGKTSSEAEISAYTKSLVAGNPEVQAIIAADKEVPHGAVITLIDVVKSSGVKKFALSTEKKK